MGGRIFSNNKGLFRLGQNFTGSYGNGLIIYKIKKLSKINFEEEFISEIRLPNPFKGPHTLDFNKEIVVWDQYIDSFDFYQALDVY